MTVDVECWGQSVLDRALPILSCAAENLRRLLDLLGQSGARATLFVLGKFAERHPDAVRAAAAAGHEIASHGHSHIELHRLDREAFRADLRRASAAIADAVGEMPTGYRAPVFSIGRSNLWALEVLAEEGFAYDASIFPFAGPRYGIADWPLEPRRVLLPGGPSIVEYPTTVISLAGVRLPVSGGGYARLLPGGLLLRALRREARRRHAPPVFYCHPYELAPGEISRHYPETPLGRRLHQNLGRAGFARKLERLLAEFACVSMGDAIAAGGDMPAMRLDGAPASADVGRGAAKPSTGRPAHSADSVGSGASTYS